MRSSSPILKTKLYRPALPQKLVRRPLLLRRLDEGLKTGRQITLVSAPAGFGKTTCISEWINSLDFPAAWLSLDPSDDDPARFFVYLINALKIIDKNLGHEIEAVIRSGQVPPNEVISATIINNFVDYNGQFLLVLDDFHIIQDSVILAVLENLVVNHPPPLHLVMLTREDPPLPLARLRANNKLTEIRAKDLRFSEDDIKVFLNEVMGLSISEDDIALLGQKTEGWIVGLQLAGLSIRDHDNPSNFISKLGGSHRFILSYLTEQVLNQQPEEVHQFLLQTSILDKFNSDLCNAVTERLDAGELLERLYNANLFLVPLDDEHRWFRYHHLFADLLRDLQHRSNLGQIKERHQHASGWYASAGMVNEAIQHALAAEDFAMAIGLLESHAMGMIMQGYAKTVNNWVQVIPGEWRNRSPKTHLAFAWMHLLRGAYSEASPYLQGLEKTISTTGSNQNVRHSLKAEWLVMRSLLLSMEGNLSQSQKLIEDALEIVPENDSRVRSMVYFGLACVHQSEDNYELAVNSYQKAIRYGRVSGNDVTVMLSTSGLAQLAFEHGHLQMTFEIAEPVCKQLEQTPLLPPISTVVFGILGEVYYQWYKTQQTRHYFQHAYQLSALGGLSSGMINCRVLLSRISLLEGKLDAAASEIQNALDLIRGEIPNYVRQEVIAQQTRVYLAQDRLTAAQMVLHKQGFSFHEQFTYPTFPSDLRISYSTGLLYNSSLHVLLYQARNDRDTSGIALGIDLANRMIDGVGKNQPTLTKLETLLLRAQLYGESGDLAASQNDYFSALMLGESGGFVGVFVEQGPLITDTLSSLVRQDLLDEVHLAYVERILSALSKPGETIVDKIAVEPSASTKESTPIEPLSDRELDVLRLMVEGLTYREIAARLYISLNTVRYHIKSIYGKLNVNNRTQAIEKARHMHML